ncbi:uncharacterized protein LOC108744304 isoform X1 [Agrilus planipennis]|uniref:Uncharacterized protein LOC108744304 isoform X1 n=1 Tax=Agrilus planipennis TaxID=224129 RepID=A0A1W4XSV6_AGRPL|nr:uncharacterized protein LOC108744304 isoform X1 [Agrilus planipennis]
MLNDISGKIIIKVQLGDDIRRIPIHNDAINYDELVLMMQRIFQGKLNANDDITIKYKDEDGDLITIFDSSDLSFAIQCNPVLKLQILMNNKGKEGERRSVLNETELDNVKDQLRKIRDQVNQLLDTLDTPTAVTSLKKENVDEQKSSENVPTGPSGSNSSKVSKVNSSEFDPLQERNKKGSGDSKDSHVNSVSNSGVRPQSVPAPTPPSSATPTQNPHATEYYGRTTSGKYQLQEQLSEDDMPLEEFEKAASDFLYDLSDINRALIEIETRDQANCSTWMFERRKRITASNFGRICKLQSTTNTKKTIESLLYNKFNGNEATKYGKMHEKDAIEVFEMTTNLKVKKSGLFIDKDYPFLGASPDGLINDDCLIEIKCPINSRDVHPIVAAMDKKLDFCEYKDNKVYLKKNHNYMYQIQGQLKITQRKLCYFVVWSPYGIHIEEIERDDIFWKQKMEDKLKKFYFECLLPELVDPRKGRNKSLRDIYLD